MLVTDFTIEWIGPQEAKLVWSGGATTYWYTIYVDGGFSQRFSASGDIETIVRMDGRRNHSVAIVRHDAPGSPVVSPDSVENALPTVRWESVEGAARYEVTWIEDGVEYPAYVRHAQVGDPSVLSFTFPARVNMSGQRNISFRVYAYGNEGACPLPSVASGGLFALPVFAEEVAVEVDSGGDLNLVLVAST